MSHNSLLTLLFMSVTILLANPSLARDSGVNGTIAARETFDSNTNRTKENKVSAWSTKVTPTLALDSKGSTDLFLLTYSPSYTMNHETKTEKLDHYLSVSENASPTSKWLIGLSEKYIRTDDAAENEDSSFLNSTKLQRNRFWTNIANLNSTVLLGPGSSLGLGYTNTILENESADQADYMRQEPTANIAWQVSPRLQTNISYIYSEGDFDLIPSLSPMDPAQPQDIQTHTASVGLAATPVPHSKISLNYQYVDTEFTSQNSDPDQEPYEIHSGNLRLDQVVTQSTNFALFFGPSLIDRQTTEDQNSYNYGLELSSTLQKGKFLLSGLGGVDELYFNGTGSDGLTIYRSATSSLNYNLTENLATDISGSVRRDKLINQIPEGRETTYEGRLGLSYTWQWLTASISGQYYKLKTDTNAAIDEGYDGYRAYFTLSAGNEFLRW